MISLGLVNNSGGNVWLEVHGHDEIRPVMRATQPLGPFSCKAEWQKVGDWPLDALVVFLYDGRADATSFYRLDISAAGEETLLVTPDKSRVMKMGANYRPSSDSGGPLWLRWLTFSVLVLVPLLALVIFAVYKTFFASTITNHNDGSLGGMGRYGYGYTDPAAPNLIFEDD